jgi:hypothetical protein
VSLVFLDPVGGLAGDMILGALLDAGAPEPALRQALASLPVDGYRLDVREEIRRGFRGRRVEVVLDPDTPMPSRHLHHVLAILEKGDLPPRARSRARSVFEALARAEAEVHGTTVEKVHFHEVGAVDAIVDIAGIAIALELLDVAEVRVGVIPLGEGTTTGAHGEFPLPAPATVALLEGWPVRFAGRPGEHTTPTGAAVVRALAAPGLPSDGRVLGRVGVGHGRRAPEEGPPNLVRALLLDVGVEVGAVDVVECAVDDTTGEVLGDLVERLLATVARDVHLTPVIMKKSRPGILITVLADAGRGDEVAALLLSHTSSLGVRVRRDSRRELPRSIEEVTLSGGSVRMKVVNRPHGATTAAAEYEDCREISERTGRPVAEVLREAEARWREGR